MQNINIIGMSIILNLRYFTYLQVTLSYLCFVVENRCEIVALTAVLLQI